MGSYSVTMTDSVGCSLFDNIILNQPTEITSSYVTSDVLCNGDSTGTASVTFNGGVTDYLLSWTGYNYPLPNGLNTFITLFGVYQLEFIHILSPIIMDVCILTQ